MMYRYVPLMRPTLKEKGQNCHAHLDYAFSYLLLDSYALLGPSLPPVYSAPQFLAPLLHQPAGAVRLADGAPFVITARMLEFLLLAVVWAAFVTAVVSLIVTRIGRKK